MLAQSVAGALDLHHDGVVQEAVEERGCDDLVAEHVAPLGEAAIAGEDHGAALVAGVDQLEKQVAGAGADRQVADLVGDQERGPAEKPYTLTQRALAFGPRQRGDNVGERGEVDAAPGADRLNAEGNGEMGLAGAGRPKQVQHLVAADKIELRQGQNTVAVERRLEQEVVALQGLDRGKPGHAQRCFDTAALAQGAGAWITAKP